MFIVILSQSCNTREYFVQERPKGAILNPNFNIIEDFLIKKPLKGGNSDEFRWRLLIIKN